MEEWQNVIATNLHAAFYLIRGVLPGMIERGSGSIIGLGGQAAITGRPETAVVTTAKTGLHGLIRAVAAECAEYGVRANLVNPGSTDTSRAHPEWYPEFQDVERGSNEHLQGIPLGRQATVQDIANACLFYASDESSYITGDRMNVVGGRYIVLAGRRLGRDVGPNHPPATRPGWRRRSSPRCRPGRLAPGGRLGAPHSSPGGACPLRFAPAGSGRSGPELRRLR